MGALDTDSISGDCAEMGKGGEFIRWEKENARYTTFKGKFEEARDEWPGGGRGGGERGVELTLVLHIRLWTP
jgi:hypothetical protein